MITTSKINAELIILHLLWHHGQTAKTLLFHGGIVGSIPTGVTNNNYDAERNDRMNRKIKYEIFCMIAFAITSSLCLIALVIDIYRGSLSLILFQSTITIGNIYFTIDHIREYKNARQETEYIKEDEVNHG